MVNRLWRNVAWGQRGNFLSVPTDCPQRDERLGWLADAQVFLPSAALNMDVAAFITKWGDDILDAQSPEGALSGRRAADRVRARRRARLGRRRRDRPVDDLPALRRRADPRAPLGRDGALHGLSRPAQPGPAVALAPQQRLRRLAVGRRPHAARGARDRLPGLRRAAHGADGARARAPGQRGPATRRCAATVVAAFNRAYVGDDAFIEGDTQTVYLLALHMDLLPEELRARRGGAPGRRHRAPRLAPDHRLRRRRAALPGADRARLRRRRPPAAAQRDLPVVGLLDPPRRDHDLGALGRLDRGARLPDRR